MLLCLGDTTLSPHFADLFYVAVSSLTDGKSNTILLMPCRPSVFPRV